LTLHVVSVSENVSLHACPSERGIQGKDVSNKKKKKKKKKEKKRKEKKEIKKERKMGTFLHSVTEVQG
jgi:hypothetical protein